MTMEPTACHRVSGWVDVHAHFTPPMSDEERENRWHAILERKFMLSAPYVWTPEGTLDYMNRAGIQMQMLSNIPKTLEALRESNDYAASLVKSHPTRFGFLAALPIDNPTEALAEISRAYSSLHADGFAVTCCYNGIYLGDASLDSVWSDLNDRGAVVFAHPDAYAPPNLGRPAPLLEVAFETARTVVDMLYAGWFRRFPRVKLVVAHCGGALMGLVGRILLLGTEPWVPNPHNITKEEMRRALAGLFVDTAATGSAHSLLPALEVLQGPDHVLYGSDCGVPCTREATSEGNLQTLLDFNCEAMSREECQAVGTNALKLFPAAAARIERSRS